MTYLEVARDFHTPVSANAPYSVPVIGSEQPGRSAIWRHWRFRDGHLKSLDPNITTAHQMFENTANRQPNNKCFGSRSYDPSTKTFGKYQWLTYGEVQRRRANLGAGIVQVNKDAGVLDQKYGIGLWCQNRPEWQITGNLDEEFQAVSLLTVTWTWRVCRSRSSQSPYMIHWALQQRNIL